MSKAALSPDSLEADRKQALKLIPVSRETAERLDRFVALLLQWQATHNLIAPSTIPTLWTRHIADSLQLLTLAPKALRWADLGSGGGFPGIVLACALAERPGARIDLVERNGKKAAFLREALRTIGGSGQVFLTDIGDYVETSAGTIDCVTARAVAPLKLLCPVIAPAITRGALGLLPKGQDVENELTEATKYWNIAYRLVPSLIAGGGAIVAIDQLTPKAQRA